MTSNPNEADGIDTSGSAVPPYEGRRTAADVESKDKAYRDGANVGGATVPVENDESAKPDPQDTPRGATGSPAAERPASRARETDLDDDDVGPAHQAGVPRGESHA
jgi:hypothetical protein